MAALAAGVALLPWRFLRRKDLVRFLHDRYDYLELSPGCAEQFVDDFTRHRGRVGRMLVARAQGQGEAYTEALDHFAIAFLLSTSFFLRRDRDGGEPVRYVAFYDPYVSPCWNPLAVEGARGVAVKPT